MKRTMININNFKKSIIRHLAISALPLTFLCQNAMSQIDPVPPPPSKVQFSYDASGNRIKREVIFLNDILKTSGNAADSTYNETADENGKNNADDSFATELGGINMSIFPNPVELTLTVRTENTDESTSLLSLYDASGRLLYEKENLQPTAEVDFSKYVHGVYMLRIVINGEQKEWVIIKQ